MCACVRACVRACVCVIAVVVHMSEHCRLNVGSYVLCSKQAVKYASLGCLSGQCGVANSVSYTGRNSVQECLYACF